MTKIPTQAEVEAAVKLGILTPEQAAVYLQCTVRHLEREVARGKLRHCKTSKRFARYRLKDLKAYLANGVSTPA